MRRLALGNSCGADAKWAVCGLTFPALYMCGCGFGLAVGGLFIAGWRARVWGVRAWEGLCVGWGVGSVRARGNQS